MDLIQNITGFILPEGMDFFTYFSSRLYDNGYLDKSAPLPANMEELFKSFMGKIKLELVPIINSINDLYNKNVMSSQSVDNLSNAVSNLRASVENTANIANSLRTMLHSNVDNIPIDNLPNALLDLNNKFIILQNATQSLRADIDIAASKVADLSNKAVVTQTVTASLRADIDNNTRDNSAALQSAMESIAAINTVIPTLANTDALKACDTAIKNLLAQLEKDVTEISGIKAKITEDAAVLTALKNKDKAFDTTVNSLQSAVYDLNQLTLWDILRNTFLKGIFY